MKEAQIYTSAGAIGVIAGMRAMSAPAVISRIARKGELAVEGSKLSFLNSSGALSTSALLAVGEIIADKLDRRSSRSSIGSRCRLRCFLHAEVRERKAAYPRFCPRCGRRCISHPNRTICREAAPARTRVAGWP